MRTLFIFSIALFLSNLAFSQTIKPVYDDVYNAGDLEVSPSFEGSFENYIRENFNPSEKVKKKCYKGMTFISFIVSPSGKIEDESIQVIKGTCESLNKEAIRLLKNSPDWTAGKITADGAPVRAYITLPVPFERKR